MIITFYSQLDYSKQYEREKQLKIELQKGKRFVFQGLRQDIYEAGLEPEPFMQDLMNKEILLKYKQYQTAGVSVFADGTIMLRGYLESPS